MSVHFRDPPMRTLAPSPAAAGETAVPDPAFDRAVADTLAHAADRFRQAGRSWSPYCRQVLEILLRAHAPVRAYAMMEPLKAEGRRIYPPTIYRALATLEEMGLVHRVASLNAFTVCTRDGDAHTPAFMICDACGVAEEAPLSMEANALVEPDQGFRASSVVVELHGLCRRCGTAAPA